MVRFDRRCGAVWKGVETVRIQRWWQWPMGAVHGPQALILIFLFRFIDYIKGRFEAIKHIYSPYQIKLHLSSLCCVIVPLNSLHHTNSFSLDHDWSWWQRYGNTSFVPSLSFCVSSCLPSVVSLQLLHYSFNVSPSRLAPFTPSSVLRARPAVLLL